MELKDYLPSHAMDEVDEENFPYFFSRSLEDLYLKHTPKKKGTVFVCTQVHNGFGDYIALLKAGKALKKAHPDLTFELVYTYTKKLPEVDTGGLRAHPFLEHPEHPVLEPVLEGKKIDEISAEAILAEALYERMKESIAIVHIALALNTFDNPVLKDKSLYFAEVGNFMGIKDSLHFNWYSLGFSPYEEGIFLEVPIAPKNNPLSYFGYFSQSGHLFDALVKRLDLKAEVKILKETLSYHDFLKQMADSAFLVGCTGDNSLSECLALGKVPYYEILPHKTGLILSLYNLAHHLDLKSITAYFKAMGKGEKGDVEEIYQALTAPNFSVEWKVFISYIHKYCRLENSLVARLRRLIFKTGAKEASLAGALLEDKISYADARKEIERTLSVDSV